MKRIIKIPSILLCIFGIALTAAAQQTSRWAISNPSLLIDIPGKPSPTDLSWIEKTPYSFFPTAWAGEDAGLRVEVGKISWPNGPNTVYGTIVKKLGINSAAVDMPKISGRKTIGTYGNGYMLRVIGTDPETNSGSVWAVLVRYDRADLANSARSIISNIIAEREGTPKPVLRGLGTGRFAAMLPYELLPSESSPENPDDKEYEAYFDGMQVKVISSMPSAGYVFNADGTIKDIVEGNRQRADKDTFRAESSKIKISDEKAVLVVMDMKENGKPYKIYKVLAIEKRNSMTLTLQTDPNNTKQQETARQIISSLRTTTSPLYGWSTYKIGRQGLMIDSPIAPKAPVQQNAVTIYNIDAPLFGYEIRDVEPMFASTFDPDFAAKNYFEINSAISKDKNEILSIEKILVDGFQARLIHAKVTSGKYIYIRQMLLIYGGTTEWIIDIMGTENYGDLIHRAIQSVRVSLPPVSGTVRQSFGKLGLSLQAFTEPIKLKEPFVENEMTAAYEFNTGMIAMFEVESAVAADASIKRSAMTAANSLLKGIGEKAGLDLAAVEKESQIIVIDGQAGLHVICGITNNGETPKVPLIADAIVFRKDNRMFILVLLTNFTNGVAARANRSNILNSIRIGH